MSNNNINRKLYNAVYRNDVEKTKFYLNNGANINWEDEWNWTPLTRAAYQGYDELVKLLAIKGADIDHNTSAINTPLTLAATRGHVEVVKILLSFGANIENVVNTGVTALRYFSCILETFGGCQSFVTERSKYKSQNTLRMYSSYSSSKQSP